MSFLDRITFDKTINVFGCELWFYQPLCVVFSFICLIALISIGVFKEKWLTRTLVYSLYLGHIVGNYAALFVEGFTFKNFFFLGIGIILFFLIYLSEIMRMRETKRRLSKRTKSNTQQET